MNEYISIGYWIKRRRKSLDLTQKELAGRVGCASITIAKIEADQRRPSREVGLLLAKHLQVPETYHDLFVDIVRGEKSSNQFRKIPIAGSFFQEENAHERIETSSEEVRGAILLSRISHGKLVGRKSELALALKILELVQDEGTQVLLLRGEPGIGKSRLSLEIVNRVRENEGLVFVGNCFSSGERSYAAFSRILQGVREFPKDLPEIVIADLKVIAPQLETRFPQISSRKTLDPLAEKMRLFESAYYFFSKLCANQPALLLLEDIHWADSGSLELIKVLAHRFREEGLKILFLLTLREDLPSGFYDVPTLLDELQRARLSTIIHLERFNMDGTRELLASIFDQEITDGFIDLIYHETLGNPFFVEEVCKDLIERGDIYWLNDRWERKELEDIQVPKSVQVAIRTRIQKLPPDVQEVLLTAAVLGRRFEFEILKEVSGLDEDRLISALEVSERSQILSSVENLSTMFEFSHNLISTVLFEDAKVLRRRRIHKRVVEVLEGLHPNEYSTLAYHCREADDPVRAGLYYRQAAERAMHAYAHEDAIRFYGEALSIITNNPAETCRLHLLREQVYDLSGDRSKQAFDLEKARISAEAAGKNSLRVEVELALANFNLQVPDFAKVIEHAKTAIELARKEDILTAQAHAYMFWGRALTDTGALQEAHEILTRAGELGRQTGARLIEARSLINLGNVDYRHGNFDEAKDKYERSLFLVRELGERRIECMTINNLGNIVWLKGGLDEALVHYKAALSIAVDIGDRLNEGRTLSNIGSVLTEKFAYPEAIENLELALSLFQKLHQRADELMALSHLGDVMEALARYDEARQYKGIALDIAQEINDIQGVSELLTGLSRINLHSGNTKEAMELARKAIGLSQEPELFVDDAEGWKALGNACFAFENYVEAENAFSRALTMYKEMGLDAKSCEIQAELARIAEIQGKHTLALEYLSVLLKDRSDETLANVTNPTICLSAYLVLKGEDPEIALRLLDNGYDKLQNELGRIHHSTAREHYLKNVPNHRALADYWLENHKK